MLLEIYNENRKREEKPTKPNTNRLVLGILSFFSISFGCLNLLILEDINLFTGLVILFTVVMYSFNEYYKTSSIYNYALKNKIHFLILGIICILISLTSIYGVYQVVNSYSTKKITVSYQREIDSLSLKINSNYADSLVRLTNKELYSNKMSDSLKQQLSLKKAKLENDLYEKINEFKLKEKRENEALSKQVNEKEKIKLIVLIFLLSMVVIVECVIVAVSYNNGLLIKKYNIDLENYTRKNRELLNTKIGKQFQEYVEAIKYIYSLNSVGDTFVRSKFDYIKSSKEEFINLLESLKIISDDRNSKIIVNEKEALDLIDKHFSKII